MNPKIRFASLFVAALLAGLLITWLDTRPTWDDTAILVILIFGTSAIFGAISPKYVFLWAVLIGAWIPLYAIVTRGDFAMLIVLVIPVVGGLFGALLRHILSLMQTQQNPSA